MSRATASPADNSYRKRKVALTGRVSATKQSDKGATKSSQPEKRGGQGGQTKSIERKRLGGGSISPSLCSPIPGAV